MRFIYINLCIGRKCIPHNDIEQFVEMVADGGGSSSVAFLSANAKTQDVTRVQTVAYSITFAFRFRYEYLFYLFIFFGNGRRQHT